MPFMKHPHLPQSLKTEAVHIVDVPEEAYLFSVPFPLIFCV